MPWLTCQRSCVPPTAHLCWALTVSVVQPFLVTNNLEYTMEEGNVQYSFTLISTTTTTTHPPHHKLHNIPPQMNQCPQVKKHIILNSHLNHAHPTYNPPNRPGLGFIKNTNFFQEQFGFEKTPSQFCQTIRIIWFMHNLKEIQSMCYRFVCH